MDQNWEILKDKLRPQILDAISALNFKYMTPVQAACIPHFLQNKDMAVEAVTGSGKTLAFVVPMMQMLCRREDPLKKHEVGAIILTPTRELAVQISEVVDHFLKFIPDLTSMLFIGGGSPQEDVNKFIENGAHIIVATPGRFEDLLEKKEKNFVLAKSVKALELLVLDEADRLLDMGFEVSITTIFGYLPKLRRTGLFSATQTDEVSKLIRAGLRNPLQITVKEKSTGKGMNQRTPSTLSNYYMIANANEKPSQLVQFLQNHRKEKVMVFFSTCASVDYFSRCLKIILKKHQILSIHSKMKDKRNKTFANFRKWTRGVLICTDVMARGVDIPDVKWVVQFDPPTSASAFVHRCGRTARIGNEGNALIMLLPSEDSYIKFLEINQRVPLRQMKKFTNPPEVTTVLQTLAVNDRAVYEKGMRAFVSNVQAYAKHECKLLLRVKDLDFGEMAQGYGLLLVPKMPELRGKTITNFQPVAIDVSTIKFKDKTREKLRQKKITSGESSKKKNKRTETKSWSQKKEKLEKRRKRKEKKEQKSLKRKAEEMEKKEEDGEVDMETFDDDIRLMKKLKKGKDPDFVPVSGSDSSSCSVVYPLLSTSASLEPDIQTVEPDMNVTSQTEPEVQPKTHAEINTQSESRVEVNPQTDRSMSQTNEKYKKPRRPCPYCEQLQTKLSRHLMRKHKNETSVSMAMEQPTKERDRILNGLKKQGILRMNAKTNTIGLRERAQGSNEIVMCAGCKGFYSRRRVYEHKKKCPTEHACSSGIVRFYPTAPNASEEIKSSILDRFRDDEVGNLCRSDKAIVLLATRLWGKSSKKERKVVMSDLRILGNLIALTRKRTKDPSFSGEDIVKRCNFEKVSQTIVEMSLTEDGTLKAGLKLSIGFILKKLIGYLKGEYIMQDEMEKVKEIDLFKAVLEYNWDFLFYTAQISCEAKRTNLRKPSDMPLESDVKKLREFIISEMLQLSGDNYTCFDSHLFVKLRNVIVARLTLFNARRGGEPARMLLKDWEDADSNVWIDPQLVENITDPLEKGLLAKYKLAYQFGKGSKRLVPVLIPNDTIEPLRKLIQERKSVDIPDDNHFLFPNTGQSRDHVSGYIAVSHVVALMDNLERPQLLIADKFRHRASTLFALLDVPQNERDVFYRHMGHSESINKNIYQCPLAIREITEVGNFFDQIDNSTPANSEPRCTMEAHSTIRNVEENCSKEVDNSVATQQAVPVDGDIQSSPQDSVSSETRPNSQSKRKKNRRYMAWSSEDSEAVKSYFRNFVQDVSVNGARGSLPSKREILVFLTDHKIFLGKDVPESMLADLVKTKVFNERKKYRNERAFESV